MEQDGEETEVNIPRRCMHCVNPPCANLCPWGAASKLDNGITNIDADLCLGGAKCRQVCPWGIPQRQSGVGLYLDLLSALAGNGVMYKCNRCYERVADGKVPACIEACPQGVQSIGPRDEMLAKAHARAKEINGYVYGEKENGGTNTFYVSPVPFDKINQSLEAQIQEMVAEEVDRPATGQGKNKGNGPGRNKKLMGQRFRQGRPHMAPVANSMANSENLTAALLLAPVAGAALAVGKARKALKGLTQSDSDHKEA